MFVPYIQERSRIGYVSCMYRKGQIGRVENAHVFTRIVHVSNGSNFACSERACIDMYRACIEKVQFGVHVFACIVMYRKRRFESCIEYVYRGARSIHVFGIGKIHEIHARYKRATKMEEGHDTIQAKKRVIRDDTQIWGETEPTFGGNPVLIQIRGLFLAAPTFRSCSARPRAYTMHR